jgi:hypothetical protein
LLIIFQEFGLGFFDGISGLVTQPLEGAKNEGATGFIKGFGRGISGLVVKPAAGIYALPGYAMKGVYKEIQKQFGASVNNYIIAARTAQGWEAWLETDKEFQMELVHRYLKVYEEAKKRKNVGEDQYDAVTEFMEKKKEKRRERWAKAMSAYKNKKKELVDGIHSHCPANCAIPSHKHRQSHSTSDLLAATSTQGEDVTTMHGAVDAVMQPSASVSGSHLEHARTFPQPGPSSRHEDDDKELHRDLEEAIRQSVQESSTGDTEEDRAIQRALRASIAELHRPDTVDTHETPVEEDEETQLRLALQQSMIHDHMKDRPSKSATADPEVLHIAGNHDDDHVDGDETPPAIPPMSPERFRTKDASTVSGVEVGAGSNEDEDLKKAIEESKKLHTADGVDDDGDIEKAIEESKKLHSAASAGDDGDIEKAMAESKRLEEEHEKAKKEEEIVLEYIKKQSLAEEEHRKRIAQGRETGGESSAAGGGTAPAS